MATPKPTTSSTGAPPPARIRANSPADLLALVPYLLGFRPAESLVALLLRDGQVLLTARIDLPPADRADEVVDRFGDLGRRHRAAGMVLVAYSRVPGPARELLEAVVVGSTPLGLVDALYVCEQRWWSLMCRADCCPADGTLFDPLSHPLAAEAVYAGLGTVSGREVVRARVDGPGVEDVEQLRELHRQVAEELERRPRSRRVAEMSATVTRFLLLPTPLGDAQCARLAVLASDHDVRDVAWLAMEQQAIGDHLDLWGQVVARTVAPWQPAPLCLFGMAAWIAGDGALQNCCRDRVSQEDPDDPMADLLDQINALALPPDVWPALAEDLRAELFGRLEWSPRQPLRAGPRLLAGSGDGALG